jgi:hypothetical protein
MDHQTGLYRQLIVTVAFVSFELVSVPTTLSQTDIDARIREELQYIDRA